MTFYPSEALYLSSSSTCADMSSRARLVCLAWASSWCGSGTVLPLRCRPLGRSPSPSSGSGHWRSRHSSAKHTAHKAPPTAVLAERGPTHTHTRNVHRYTHTHTQACKHLHTQSHANKHAHTHFGRAEAQPSLQTAGFCLSTGQVRMPSVHCERLCVLYVMWWLGTGPQKAYMKGRAVGHLIIKPLSRQASTAALWKPLMSVFECVPDTRIQAEGQENPLSR